MTKQITNSRPSKANPQLIKRLARATLLIREIHDLINSTQMAPDLGMRKQSFESHIKKAEKGNK